MSFPFLGLLGFFLGSGGPGWGAPLGGLLGAGFAFAVEKTGGGEGQGEARQAEGCGAGAAGLGELILGGIQGIAYHKGAGRDGGKLGGEVHG